MRKYPPTKRSIALTTIRAEVAKHGEVTKAAARAYVENRISYEVFQKTVAEGVAIYGKLD